MPTAMTDNGRIRTNIPSENAYNALGSANRDIALRQLRLSTGLRINNAGDDVAGYITSRALLARNGSLKAAQNAVGDATNVANIVMDSLNNIGDLLTKIKDATAQASSGAMGTDEKVALSKSSYRLAQQIQTVVDSTVFGGAQLLNGTYSANFIVGFDATNKLLSLKIDMTSANIDFNIESGTFDVNSTTASMFAGVAGLDLISLNAVSSNDLGIFDAAHINTTLSSLADAINNVNKVAAYLGGISNRLQSQDDILKNQIVNYNSAISRIQDADVAKEQLDLIRAQFLQQASLVSLAQANQNPSSFLQLLQR